MLVIFPIFMSLDDPNKVQKEQINRTDDFIEEQEKMLRKQRKLLEFLYKVMTGYHPPDSDLKPFYDRFIAMEAFWQALLAELKLYSAENYTDYAGLREPDQESF